MAAHFFGWRMAAHVGEMGRGGHAFFLCLVVVLVVGLLIVTGKREGR